MLGLVRGVFEVLVSVLCVPFLLLCGRECLAESAAEPGLNAPVEIRIPPGLDPLFFHRNAYSTALLEQALSKSGFKYRLRVSDIPIGNVARIRRLISSGEYDVSWIHTSKEIEQELRAIRIPLFKGIIGWRIAFVHLDRLAAFSGVARLEHLQKFVAVQGFDWPDVAILENSGLKVRVGVGLHNVRQLFLNRRSDFFPRSISEIWDELEYYSGEGVAVEPGFAIHYPSAVYFFVNRNNVALANAIESGLELSIQDGSFDQLFFRYFGEAIDRAGLQDRNVIYLDNPHLPEETPLSRRELWFHQND